MTKLKIYISIFVPFLAILVTASSLSGVVVAKEKKEDTDAKVSFEINSVKLDRREVLARFLAKYNSPLKDNVDTFIEVADKYGLDYRLLPAISCMESTCGKHLIVNSHNAWGWGIYGNQTIYFKNFDEGIETVGKGIYEGYAKKGLNTPAKMAPVYTPPRANHWLSGVSFFMNQMDEIADQI